MEKKLIFNNICSEELEIVVVEGPPEVLSEEAEAVSVLSGSMLSGVESVLL